MILAHETYEQIGCEKTQKKKYDKNGLIAKSGMTDELILNQALENFNYKLDYEKSLDVKLDFDQFFCKRTFFRKWRKKKKIYSPS